MNDRHRLYLTREVDMSPSLLPRVTPGQALLLLVGFVVCLVGSAAWPVAGAVVYALDPISLALIAGGSAALASATPKIAGYLGTRFSPSGKALKSQEKRDVALVTGKPKVAAPVNIGVKRQMAAEAARGIRAQTKSSETQLKRDAAAIAGVGRSGRTSNAANKLLEMRTEAQAQAGGMAEKQFSQDRQVAQNKLDRDAAAAMARLYAKKAEIKEDWESVGESLKKGVEVGADAATGGAASAITNVSGVPR